MEFDKILLRDRLTDLANKGVFIGTSSWKYPGWRGMIYDESRYLYRGKFAKSRFEENCLAEYAEVFKTVCVDAAYYTLPSRQYLQGLAAQVPPDFKFGFKVTDAITIKRFPDLPRFGPRKGMVNENFLNTDAFVGQFLEPCEAIRSQVGILIFEFSRFHRVDYQDLREFIADLDAFLSRLPKGWPLISSRSTASRRSTRAPGLPPPRSSMRAPTNRCGTRTSSSTTGWKAAHPGRFRRWSIPTVRVEPPALGWLLAGFDPAAIAEFNSYLRRLSWTSPGKGGAFPYSNCRRRSPWATSHRRRRTSLESKTSRTGTRSCWLPRRR